MFHKKIPKKYKNKPIGKIFNFPDKKYGSIDVKITIANQTTGYKKNHGYWVETCIYTNKDARFRCVVNRWGCNIHFRSRQSNIFGIED